MECAPLPSDQLVEQLIAQGHVTTRRPHHGRNLARDLNIKFSPSELLHVIRYDGALLDWIPNVGIEELCMGIIRMSVEPSIRSAGDQLYSVEPYRTMGMTYREDLYGNTPEALINCIAAFDAYALLMGPDAPVRFTAGRDEICDSTAHKIHCDDRRSQDHVFDEVRLLPDEQDLEWITNFLRLRIFRRYFPDVINNLTPWIGEALISAEKWLITMTLEIDGLPVNEEDLLIIDNIEAQRVTILSLTAVMLDTEFYNFISRNGLDIDRCTRPFYQDDYYQLQACGFNLTEFKTK